MRALLLSTVVATFTLVGSASAGPVTMSEDSLDQVTAGSLNLRVFKNVLIQKLKNIHINARLNARSNVHGNLAEAEAGANAVGRNTFAETLTITDVKQGRSSSAFSESVSATNGARARVHRPCRC